MRCPGRRCLCSWEFLVFLAVYFLLNYLLSPYRGVHLRQPSVHLPLHQRTHPISAKSHHVFGISQTQTGVLEPSYLDSDNQEHPAALERMPPETGVGTTQTMSDPDREDHVQDRSEQTEDTTRGSLGEYPDDYEDEELYLDTAPPPKQPVDPAVPPSVPRGWGGLLAAGSVVEEMVDTGDQQILQPVPPDNTYNDRSNSNQGNSGSNLKTILFWNTFFESSDFRFGLGQNPFFDWRCPVYNCRTSNDKSELSHASAVMFHGPRIPTFPSWRSPNQVYVYLQQEPHETLSADEQPLYHDRFNLTVSHRTVSDILLPYAKIYHRPPAERTLRHVSVRARKRDIVWVVSHCHTPVKREWYVKELRKYINVDIYGGCGKLKCNKDDFRACFEKFQTEYKFYLSMENNYCQDYVSEKLYRPLEYDIIPIVFGGANYSAVAPPHSVINVLDYPNPRQLATYLKHLSQNDKAYNRYFAWKDEGYIIDTGRKAIMGEAFCKLCEILNDPDYPYRSEAYRDLKHWWVDGMCDTEVIADMRRTHNW